MQQLNLKDINETARLSYDEELSCFFSEFEAIECNATSKMIALKFITHLSNQFGLPDIPALWVNEDNILEFTWRDSNKNHIDIRFLETNNTLGYVIFKNNNGEMQRIYGKATRDEIFEFINQLKLEDLMTYYVKDSSRSIPSARRQRYALLQTFDQSTV